MWQGVEHLVVTPEEQTGACHGQALVVVLGWIRFGSSAGEEHWKTCVVAHCEDTAEVQVEVPAEEDSVTLVEAYFGDHLERPLEEC